VADEVVAKSADAPSEPFAEPNDDEPEGYDEAAAPPLPNLELSQRVFQYPELAASNRSYCPYNSLPTTATTSPSLNTIGTFWAKEHGSEFVERAVRMGLSASKYPIIVPRSAIPLGNDGSGVAMHKFSWNDIKDEIFRQSGQDLRLTHVMESETEQNPSAVAFVQQNHRELQRFYNNMFDVTETGGPVFANPYGECGIQPGEDQWVALPDEMNLQSGFDCKAQSNRNTNKTKLDPRWEVINDDTVHISSRTLMATFWRILPQP
jgi:hypothetical protein